MNNPALEATADVGLIPARRYQIGASHPNRHTGPITMNLTPVGHDARSRTLFRIHGDNSAHDNSASHGCIILPPRIREAIAHSDDRALVVIAGSPSLHPAHAAAPHPAHPAQRHRAIRSEHQHRPGGRPRPGATPHR